MKKKWSRELSPIVFSAELSNNWWKRIFQKVPEGYLGFMEELPGANTQGANTQGETRANLQEAITLVLEANRQMAEGRLQGTQEKTFDGNVLASRTDSGLKSLGFQPVAEALCKIVRLKPSRKYNPTMSVKEIQTAIAELPQEELANLLD